jgi:hypothetical protein
MNLNKFLFLLLILIFLNILIPSSQAVSLTYDEIERNVYFQVNNNK